MVSRLCGPRWRSASSGLVSRSRAMPVWRPALLSLLRRVALPGAPGALHAGWGYDVSAACAMRVIGGGSFARCAGDAGQGCRGWFRAPARCRSEDRRSYPCYAGSSGGSFARCAGDAGQGCRGWFRAPARCRSETGAPILAMRGVAGGVSRAARAMLVRVVGAGFALPRDAGRRPPPGELPSAPMRRCGGCRGWFRALRGRCRSGLSGAPTLLCAPGASRGLGVRRFCCRAPCG